MLADILHALLFLVSSVINFIAHLPTYVSQLASYITHLPPFLIGAASAMIPVLIINKLLHNGGGT